MEACIRVYLLAANRFVRDALTRMLTRKGDIRVVGASAWSPEADVLDALLSTEHDLLLADWTSCGEGILTALTEIREHFGEHKSILLGAKGDRESFLLAVKAGARGVLLEDASAADVAAAVRAVISGNAVCPPSLCAHLFDAVARPSWNLPSARLRVRLGLTRREQQVVPLIAGGLTNKEIAAHLCLSEQTVKNHIHRMLQKTGVRGRLEVVEACQAESPATEAGHSCFSAFETSQPMARHRPRA